MIVAVTGSEGKLGRATTALLREKGHTVVRFDADRGDGEGFTRVDLSDYGQTLDALLGVTARHEGVDALVHLAAIPVNGLVPDVTTFTNNVGATFHALHAAHRAGIDKIVFASSITAAGFPFEVAPAHLPVDETMTAAWNTYGLGKVAEEAIASELARWNPRVTVTALRFTNVVDDSDYDTFEHSDEPDYRRDLLGSWVDARDGATAIVLALGRTAAGYDCFNVAHPESGHADRSRALAERWFPGTPVAEDLEPFESLFSSRRLRDELGFIPRHNWCAHRE